MYYIYPIKSINTFYILCSLMCNVLFVNILFKVYNLDSVNMLLYPSINKRICAWSTLYIQIQKEITLPGILLVLNCNT